jgi:putative DNA primase/helicase
MLEVRERAVGRWRSMLLALGMPETALTGKHGPCPFCGGKDRWRWDDKEGRGTYICSQCPQTSGDGFHIVMHWLGVDFTKAKEWVEEQLPNARALPPPAAQNDRMREKGLSIWNQATVLDGNCAASIYLERRGIRQPYPRMLRYHDCCDYYDQQDGSRSRHPVMIARFVSPDTRISSYHLTYLTRDGEKANVGSVRKTLGAPMPKGGAVRLCNSAETMGVAEGIETAMSAAQIDDVPVWSCLSANAMLAWMPPATAKHIIVYGDNDKTFTGQSRAMALANRLSIAGLDVDVRIPALQGDWNNVLRMNQ